MTPEHYEYEGGAKYNPETKKIEPAELTENKDEISKETKRGRAGQPPHKIEKGKE